ncbi:hypothetical protein Cgig2_024080 [Carnegiea gigantea]|uniref:Uncharacterized protein n=1 Tax=Carnegiea gigantea TaxID=171969 RepID=A0A9Q1QDR9_9CARY|nr:hypothetical protein Cgig2_024080 [Carnegiea gigantea]
MESALTELCWSTFESWVWLNGDRIFEARFQAKAEQKKESPEAEQVEEGPEAEREEEGSATEGATSSSNDDKQEEIADFVRESFRWRWSRATRPPHPLPDDYEDYDLTFCCSRLIEQRSTSNSLRWFRENLRWLVTKSSNLRPNLLPLNFKGLCPKFDHLVAIQFAHATHIPEMVQSIFYTMVINDVAKPGLLSRDAMGRMMLDLLELKWDIIKAWLVRIDERLRDA